MSLEFRHIAHAYGTVAALEDVSFTAHAGEITCLLGSSGCGKSTLLNLAAGLLPLQHGSISVHGEVMAEPGISPPPEARPVGLVFQDGALFPHMTIARNVAFGIDRRRAGEVENWLSMVGLEGMGARYPHELSGGQQQRAALARAMAPGPQVLLMDEPFASVDIVLRRKLRRDCRRLLRSSETTTILVTHDPDEALDVADRIAVMESGRIVQFGTPDQLHRSPATASVGAIFGGAQIIKASRSGEWLETAFGRWETGSIHGPVPDETALDLLVFADQVLCEPASDGLEAIDNHPLGTGHRIVLRSPDGAELTVESDHPIDASSHYSVTPFSQTVRAFPRN